MTIWKLSSYTAEVKSGSGDLVLHNSFMGAVAVIPAAQAKSIDNFLKQGINEQDLSNHILKELCDGGFFVPSYLDERKLVSEVLYRERTRNFHLIILPHENCNFRCTYCYETFERGKMNADIVAGLKILVERKAKQGKNITASWFGGEPLLAKDIIYELSESFIASCNRNNVQYRGTITTNGYFLTPEVVESLLRDKVKDFQVTVDGPAMIHNSTRMLVGGQGTYKKIMENLTELHHRRDEFVVTLRVNFNETTISGMDEFLSELSTLFKGDPRFFLSFHPIGKWGGPNDAKLDVCDAESAWLKSLELDEKALTSGFSNQGIKERLMPHGNVCYAGKESSIVVRSDGKICKCTVALEDPRNHVGQLTKDGQLHIDQSIWNLWVKLDDKDDTKCGSCSFGAACQSRACPLIAINEKEPPCPMTKSQYESLVKLAAFGKLVDVPIRPKLINH